MVGNWALLSQELTRLLEIDKEIMDQIYLQSRPMEQEDKKAHKRSGQTGQYHHVLAAATTSELNDIFYPVLRRYGYDV